MFALKDTKNKSVQNNWLCSGSKILNKKTSQKLTY